MKASCIKLVLRNCCQHFGLLPAVRVGPLRTAPLGQGSRAEAVVDGQPLWFECAEAPLTPSPEAFLSALLIPAMARSRGLHLSDPVDPGLADNLPAIQAMVRHWWGHCPARIRAALKLEVDEPSDAARGRTGLFFSAGADSFYTPPRSPDPIHWLVLVAGFDFPVHDRCRIDRLRAICREDLVRRFLRVCYQNTGAQLNCSVCEKCVRTQVLLRAVGADLADFPVFDQSLPLAERIDALPPLEHRSLVSVYETALSWGLNGAAGEAVARLLDRSRSFLQSQENTGRSFRALLRRPERKTRTHLPNSPSAQQ